MIDIVIVINIMKVVFNWVLILYCIKKFFIFIFFMGGGVCFWLIVLVSE